MWGHNGDADGNESIAMNVAPLNLRTSCWLPRSRPETLSELNLGVAVVDELSCLLFASCSCTMDSGKRYKKT